MKIALCLYGVVGSAKGKAHLEASDDILSFGYKKYFENIIKDNDVDVFIHSWSKDKEDQILNFYKPVSHSIEEQEIFEIPKYIKGNSSSEPRRVEFVFSRWRSTQKVLRLKMSYEKENNFDYDLCLLSRFDVAFESKLDFRNVKKDKINFSNWYNQSESTAFIETVPKNYSLADLFMFGTNKSFNPSSWGTYQPGANNDYQFYSRISSAYDFNASINNSDAASKLSFGLSGTTYSASYDGNTVTTGSNSGVPTGINTLEFNKGVYGISSIYVKRFTYYPYRLADTRLHSLTA